MRNKIPRNFNKITGKMLVETSGDQIGDVVHVYKNDHGYLGLNTRTGSYAYCFVSMLRISEVFEIMNIE